MVEVRDIQELIRAASQAGFSDVITAVSIALAEGSGNPRAHCYNCIKDSRGVPIQEDSRGDWQINVNAHPQLLAKFDLFDRIQNAQAAFDVFQRQGYGAWSVYKNGSYTRYLAQVREVFSSGDYGDGVRPGDGVVPGTGPGDNPSPPASTPGTGDGLDLFSGGFGDLIKKLSDPSYWWRALFAIVGTALIITGLMLYFGGNAAVKVVTKGAI